MSENWYVIPARMALQHLPPSDDVDEDHPNFVLVHPQAGVTRPSAPVLPRRIQSRNKSVKRAGVRRRRNRGGNRL